jgi:hypothetical protein
MVGGHAVNPLLKQRLRLQPVGRSQRAGAIFVFSGTSQFGDLPDVTDIVHRPFVQHLRQGDFAVLLMDGDAIARAGRQAAEEVDVAFPLFFDRPRDTDPGASARRRPRIPGGSRP